MVIYISILNIITLNKKKINKKRVLLHVQSVCDKSSTIYKRIPLFELDFYIIQKYKLIKFFFKKKL